MTAGDTSGGGNDDEVADRSDEIDDEDVGSRLGMGIAIGTAIGTTMWAKSE